MLELKYEDDGTSQRVVLKGGLTIGRSSDNDIVLRDFSVSRHHAKVTSDEDGIFQIVDLKSTNGIKINDDLVPTGELAVGDFEDVRPWMGAADLFVAPSLSEGMPNAVLEAMAMGLPLVLSDIPGHREAAGPDAWYFPPGDAEALAGALAEALSSPEEREARGRRGRRRIEEQLSLDAMVGRVEGLYERLAGNRA